MELIVFIGLQGSGKSTFYYTYFAATHDYISRDLLGNNKNPNRRQLQLIESAFQAKHSVVVDNTNPTFEVRKLLIELGHLYGATITGYYFEPNLKQSLERNKQRSGKAKVPDVAIYATNKKLEPPAYAEGFDKIYIVRTAANALFEINEWSGNTLMHHNHSLQSISRFRHQLKRLGGILQSKTMRNHLLGPYAPISQ